VLVPALPSLYIPSLVNAFDRILTGVSLEKNCHGKSIHVLLTLGLGFGFGGVATYIPAVKFLFEK
jgi:hypothetical protein